MLGNRVIKFRAYSNGVKADSVSTRRQFGEWIFPPQMMYDEKFGDCLVWKSKGQNLEVMQFTGLLDKNGKEIYEGDFFKGWNGVYVVAWLPFDAGFYLVQYEEWEDFLEGGESPVDVYTLNAKRYEFLSQVGAGEVIGNIFEHPHLIMEANNNAQTT